MIIVEYFATVSFEDFAFSSRHNRLEAHISFLQKEIKLNIFKKLDQESFLTTQTIAIIPVMPLALEDPCRLVYSMFAFLFDKEEYKMTETKDLAFQNRSLSFNFREHFCCFQYREEELENQFLLKKWEELGRIWT